MRWIQMCCLNLPGNEYSHKNVGLCENCDYFFQRLCVCCFHQAFPVDFDLCLRQERCLITYPKHGLNMQRVSICTMMVLESPTACFICKKCWDTNPTYPKRTHIFFSTKHFPGQHGLIFFNATVNIILGAQPISFKKRRKLYWVGSNTCLAQSPVSTGHRSQGRARQQTEHRELQHIQLSSQTPVIHSFESEV